VAGFAEGVAGGERAFVTPVGVFVTWVGGEVAVVEVASLSCRLEALKAYEGREVDEYPPRFMSMMAGGEGSVMGTNREYTGKLFHAHDYS
jgi:hypothetical protein